MGISSDFYNRQAIVRDEEISRREQEQELMRAAQEQNRSEDPKQNGRGFYDDNEKTGSPHGFFYNFDYPVNLIIPRNQQRSLKGAASSIEAVTLKPDARISEIAHSQGAIPVDAIHDTQVHPHQKHQLVNSQKLPIHT